MTHRPGGKLPRTAGLPLLTARPTFVPVVHKTFPSPAVFLDRDGTLMIDVEYCGDPARVTVFPGAGAALAQLRAGGFRLVIIRKQSGIGRGYFTEDDFQRVQAELLRQLGNEGRLDGAYHCPECPEGASERRKPGAGMLHEAATDLGLDLARSWMVGDSRADVEAGRRAGLAGTVFVLTGKAPGEHALCQPDAVVPDLAAAADYILERVR